MCKCFLNIDTYKDTLYFVVQLEQSILDFAEALRAAGVEPDQTVALFADNSHRWLIADQGVAYAIAAYNLQTWSHCLNAQVVWDS